MFTRRCRDPCFECEFDKPLVAERTTLTSPSNVLVVRFGAQCLGVPF